MVRNQLERLQQGRHSFLTGGAGEPLLLLHGIPGSAFAWEHAGALLSEHFRVIIPDLRGFGRSQAPDGDFYMEAQARSLYTFLQGLGIKRLSIGAHDFGGPVAFTLMRLFPDLAVRTLVISATNLFTDTPIPPPLRLAAVPVLGDLFFRVAVGNRVGLRVLHWGATRNTSAASWRSFQRHLTTSGVDLTRRIFQRSLADLKGNYVAIEGMLSAITQPAFVLWGDTDPFFGTAVGERTHRALRGSQLKVYRDTGHFVPEERPKEVARDIEHFLLRAYA
jgi:pimeloyl-ACP methyl ester carboxylesterase